MEIIQGLQKVGASPKRIQAFRIAIVPEEILPFDQDAADLAGRSLVTLIVSAGLSDAATR